MKEVEHIIHGSFYASGIKFEKNNFENSHFHGKIYIQFLKKI